MKLLIFSTARKIRAYHNSCKERGDALLDYAISVEEFLNNVCTLKEREASKYETLILMQKACEKSKDLEKNLGISSEFFAFLKNNEYLFSFFKELCLEKKSIEDLKNKDFYTNYDEHLRILDEVLKNYLSLLKEKNLYDNLSLVKDYAIDWDFLEDFESIVYDLQGFLSTFERDLLEQISKRKCVILRFRTSIFNLEYLKTLPFLKDFEFELDKIYEFNISEGKILSQENFTAQVSQKKAQSFKLRSLQASFVMSEISNFIKEGLEPENIVVITPDESFCELLRALDKCGYLNFASGISITETSFYQRLRALHLGANLEEFSFDESKCYFDCKNTEQIFDYHNSLLHYFKLKAEDFKEFKYHFDSKGKCDFAYFEGLIKKFLNDEEKNAKTKKFIYAELEEFIEAELNFIKDLLENESLNFKNDLKFKEVLELFFIQINTLKLSSIGGGEVVVMGLLESRGLDFDGVIIVDFNDDFIPKRSINELFLNNEIRKRAGLISYERRENLQRFYYESLMKSAKKISLCYVENEEKMRSRFLDELNFELPNEKEKKEKENEKLQKAYLKALSLDYEPIKLDLNLLKDPAKEPKKDPNLEKHDIFENPLSFSRLETFLTQKRAYYYRYILGIPEPRSLTMQQDKERRIGNLMHKLLEDYYKNNEKNYFNEEKFLESLEKEKQTLNDLDFELLKLKIHRFAENEDKHFKQGYKVFKCEYKVTKEKPTEFKLGEKSVKLIGRIDRIDERNGQKLIIDYKTGKIKEKSYQLAFYKALGFENEDLNFDENTDAKFYDLKEAFVLTDGKNTKSLADLKNELSEIIENQKKNKFFDENEKDDNYCPYKLLYGKDLKQ